MKKSSSLVLASGIVAGAVTIYAYRNNISDIEINEQVEKYKAKFEVLIEELMEFATEVLERIYNVIYEIIQRVIYKVKSTLYNN